MSAGLGDKANWEAGLGGLINLVFHSVPQIPTEVSFEGRTALITGSNAGIGLESARQFLQKRISTLILGVRSSKKGDDTAAQLSAEFPNANILVWTVDMLSNQSVRDFASKCGTLDRLDIAILNAGGGSATFERVDGGKGRETTLQVNYIATALLGVLLIPIIARKRTDSSGPGRLTFVGSDSAHRTNLERTPKGVLDSCESEEQFNPWHIYEKTKLLLLMFVAKLAETVDPNIVILNVVNPGATKGTNLLKGKGITFRLVVITALFTLLARKIPDSARQYMLAAEVMGKESHGSFVDSQIRP